MVVMLQYRYKWNPTKPHTLIGQRLFENVKSFLNREDRDSLRFYCALGTALDRFHRTDGLFRVRNHLVLLDVTTREDKIVRSSVIFKARDRSMKRITVVGRQIAHLLNESIKRSKLVATTAAP